MPQIMFCNELEQCFDMLARQGFDGVDLFFPNPREMDAREVRQWLDRAGLSVTMLAAQGDLMDDGLFLNNSVQLPELLERSRYHLEQCAELGAMPNIGFLRGRHEGRADSLRHMADGLAAYAALAADMGVKVLLEPICRYEIDSIHTAAQALELCRQAGSPGNVSLLLDLFHMNMEEPSLCGAIAASRGHIGHVHFVDNTRAVPGRGCLPLQDIVSCLRQGGYEGYLGIEAIPGPDPAAEARDGLDFTRLLLRA